MWLTEGGCWPVQALVGEVLGDVVITVDDSVGAGSGSPPGGGAQLGAGGEAEAVGAGGTKLTSVSLTGAYQPGNVNTLPVRLCSLQTATAVSSKAAFFSQRKCKRRGSCDSRAVSRAVLITSGDQGWLWLSCPGIARRHWLCCLNQCLMRHGSTGLAGCWHTRNAALQDSSAVLPANLCHLRKRRAVR